MKAFFAETIDRLKNFNNIIDKEWIPFAPIAIAITVIAFFIIIGFNYFKNK